jgi:hypothetical protein
MCRCGLRGMTRLRGGRNTSAGVLYQLHSRIAQDESKSGQRKEESSANVQMISEVVHWHPIVVKEKESTRQNCTAADYMSVINPSINRYPKC